MPDPGVEVEVGQAVGSGGLGERLAERSGGMHQRVDVVLLSRGRGAAQG